MNRQEQQIRQYSDYIKRSLYYEVSKGRRVLKGTRLTFLRERAILCYFPDEMYMRNFWNTHTLKYPIVRMWTGFSDCEDKRIYTGDIATCRIDCRAKTGLIYLIQEEDDDYQIKMLLHTNGQIYIAGPDFDPCDIRICINQDLPVVDASIQEKCKEATRNIIDKALNCRPEIGLKAYAV